MNEQEKYTDIRELLRKLKTVSASDDFETRLHHRLQDDEHARRQKHARKHDTLLDLFRNLLGGRTHPWLVPAVGVVALIFFALYYVYNSRIEEEKTASTRNESSSVVGSDVAESNSKSDSDSIIKGNKNQITLADSYDGELHSESKQRSPKIRKQSSTDADLNLKTDISLPKIEVYTEEQKIITGNEFEKGKQTESKDESEAMKKSEIYTTEAESMAAESPSAMMKESVKLRTAQDTARKAAYSKLDLLNKKWLEEIGRKVSEDH